MTAPADPHDPPAAALSARQAPDFAPPEPGLLAEELLLDLGADVIAADEEARAMRALSEQVLNLNEIALALSSERDIDTLLGLILTKARELTDADAGTLYILEDSQSHLKSHGEATGRFDLAPQSATASAASTCKHDGGAEPEKALYFRLSQNDSVPLPAEIQRFSVGPQTLAGYVAQTGCTIVCEDAYSIPPHAPYSFSPQWDRANGYRTRSVLIVPMRNREGETIGVLQLLNRKRLPVPLGSPDDFERFVLPFDDELARLSEVVAAHAAVAIESNRLLSEVTRLLASTESAFDSFVRAAARLIDDRDPPTAGHSQRVTKMTIALATAASSESDGPFAEVSYSPHEMQELRYAALLHDVGKIGVRESIFSKSHKIDPALFRAILSRIDLYRSQRAAHAQSQILHAWKTLPREEAARSEERAEQIAATELQQIKADRAFLIQANDPTVGWVPDDQFELQQGAIARLQALFIESESGPQVLVEPDEALSLSVRRGSLSEDERLQMERHAQMSFEFLEQIAWPAHLARIPDLAHGHHEKLDGSGYPRGVRAEDIPLLVRMMTVADIFDALVAADRPYKRAMPRESALVILREEADRGALDADVVDLFLRHRIWESA